MFLCTCSMYKEDCYVLLTAVDCICEAVPRQSVCSVGLQWPQFIFPQDYATIVQYLRHVESYLQIGYAILGAGLDPPLLEFLRNSWNS